MKNWIHNYSLGSPIRQFRRCNFVKMFGSQIEVRQNCEAMGLVKKCGSKDGVMNTKEETGNVRSTRGLRRKRIGLYKNAKSSFVDSNLSMTPTPAIKELCRKKPTLKSEMFALESLPQDVLIRVICGVDHDDLKQLVPVSKAVKEATLIAKESHFAYSTPSKGRPSLDIHDLSESRNFEMPKARRAVRIRPPICEKKMADITVALFTSPDEERWPRRELFMATTT